MKIQALTWIFSQSLMKRSGGPKWTRTIDLTIISRVHLPGGLLAHIRSLLLGGD